MVENPPATQETQEMLVQSCGQEESGSRKRQPTPVFLPGEFHGQRSLVGYSPWGHKVTHDQRTEQQTLPRSGGSFSDRLRRKKKRAKHIVSNRLPWL